MSTIHLLIPERSAGAEFRAWLDNARTLPGLVQARERSGSWDIVVEQKSEAARVLLARMTELGKGKV